MAIMIKNGLSEAEINFCKYFEINLLNKHTATFDKIKAAGDLIGYKANADCPSCARSAWLELLNKYNQLAVEYNKSKIEEPIYTKYESSLEDVKIENEPEKKPLQKASVKNNRKV
jgi:hypothetical protein